jgi:hypothetical protein
MSRQDDSFIGILVGFMLGAVVCGLVIMLLVLKLDNDESAALKKPSQEATELVLSIQWKLLEASLGEDLAYNRISLEMYTKANKFLCEFRDSNTFYGKPPSDYTITDSGAVVFNWNKVIYHRIEND